MARDGHEVRHAGTEATALVGIADRADCRLRVLRIRQERRKRWLVRHERPNVLGVLCHERQGVHRATAAREEIHGSPDLLDDPVQVIGVLVRIRLRGRVRLGAAFGTAGVVRDDRPVREMVGQ
jgi:hypothetical protein